MKKLKKLWGEFKKFISQGNVLDLAVGVIIATAFSAIVTSLTDDILMPLINLAVGGDELTGICTVLHAEYVDGVLDVENSIIINWGTFIKTIIDFILIAIVIFAIVKIMNSLREKNEQLNKGLKREKSIRKLAKKISKEQGISLDEAKVQAEAKIAADEAPKPAEPPKPTVEELLTEIRNLLAENAKSGTEGDKDSPSENAVEGK